MLVYNKQFRMRVYISPDGVGISVFVAVTQF